MSRAQSALSAIPGAIPTVPTNEVQTLKKAIAETHQLRDAVAFMVSDMQRLIYEVERERAVSVRLMHAAAEGPKFLVAGTGTRRHSVEQLVELHEQYAAEYDAMMGLVVLAESARERSGG